LTLLERGTTRFHGYELAKHLQAVSDARLLTAYGTLYRALTRLEEMGLLESKWEDPEVPARENRPGRRLYSLTAKGEETARTQRAAQGARPAARDNRRLRPA
jgi:DNA-binding PadR family transcriptional regulator